MTYKQFQKHPFTVADILRLCPGATQDFRMEWTLRCASAEQVKAAFEQHQKSRPTVRSNSPRRAVA